VIAATEITNAGSRKKNQVNVLMVLAIVWIGAGAFSRTGEQSEAAEPPMLIFNAGGEKHQIPQPAAFLPSSTFGPTGPQHGAREVGVIGRGRTALPFEPQTNHIVDARKRIPGLVGEIAVGEILACDVGFTPDRVVCAP
jgi:hypothetical protein